MPLDRADSEDEAPPPRSWSFVAGALILIQAVGVVAYGRPDWDDCFYLAAALDYKEGTVLNDQDPSHREGFPVQAIYRLMSWELWGGTLGRLSGIGPLSLFHSLLPCFLVLACYGAYRAVLVEILPRRWVPLALIGLCGFHLWGISNTGNASNHFLARVWQGKSVLLHLGIPLTTVAVLRFARQLDWGWWLTLCICIVASLGLSSSAIFLMPCLLTCLIPLLLPIVSPNRRLAYIAGCGLSLVPLVSVGLLIRAAVQGDAAYHPEAPAALETWYREWLRYAGSGSAEFVWLASLPILWITLPSWRSRAYLVLLPLLLFLTFGNPLLQRFVASHLTAAVTYYRLFWLYPVGIGLGALLAILSRLVSRLLAPGLHLGESSLALAVCLVGLGATLTLPGVAAWSKRNTSGPYMTPVPSVNLEQMPAELKIIAQSLAAEPDIESQRIACGEEVASFLTPFNRHFRFVATRPGYTMYSVGRERGAIEAAERLYLVEALRSGRLFPALPEEAWQLFVRTIGQPPDAPRPDPWPSLQSLPSLLDRYNVGYAIASPALGRTQQEIEIFSKERDNTLAKTGFRRIYRGDQYSLWQRKSNSAAKGRASSNGDVGSR
jgi:hypothetical protein